MGVMTWQRKAIRDVDRTLTTYAENWRALKHDAKAKAQLNVHINNALDDRLRLMEEINAATPATSS